MNAIDFKIVKVTNTVIDGIKLENCLLIELMLDDRQPHDVHFFEDSYLILDQLIESQNKPGNYYLFSGVSGILEEDGWEAPSQVLHDDGLVKWILHRGGKTVTLFFEAGDYKTKIGILKNKVISLNMTVEPARIFFE